MKTITWENFVEQYKPIKNKVKGASIDGFMFETFGEELKILLEKANIKMVNGKNGYHIWTVIDGEKYKLYLSNGWHIINRLGYLITKKAWKEGEDIIVEV